MKPIKVIAVGDIMPGDSATCVGWGTNSTWPGRRYRKVLDSARQYLDTGDLVIGNLESPLALSGCGNTRRKRDQMRAAPDVAIELASAGFDVLSVANNHAMQHGRDAFDSTVESLIAAGIDVIGLRGEGEWTSKPVLKQLGDVSVGLLAYCWRPPQYHFGQAPFAEGTSILAALDIKRLRSSCDYVIVSLHWGDEFVVQPSESQVEMARELAQAGAGLIIGHHPHVTQPVERIDGAIVAFSLGNFSSDMLWLESTRAGFVLSCHLGEDGFTVSEVRKVRTADDYTVSIHETQTVTRLSPLDNQLYAKGVQDALGKQRLAAYSYTLKNLHRFPPAVALDLVSSTIKNKLLAYGMRKPR